MRGLRGVHAVCFSRGQAGARTKRAACTRSVPAALRLASLTRPQVMVGERGGKLYATDDRYCIDNGAMIAWPGLLAFKQASPGGLPLQAGGGRLAAGCAAGGVWGPWTGADPC